MKRTNKKSQGLSINIIIIAAIGLIVLIILGFIFRGESGKFVKGMNCPARKGVCLVNAEGKKCPDDKPATIYTNDCPEIEFQEGEYVVKEPEKRPGQCCIPIS